MQTREETPSESEKLYSEASKLAMLAYECKEIEAHALYYKQAIELFDKAASLGNRNAIITLAQCYKLGVGVETSETKAVAYYQQALDLGYYEVLNALGVCYAKGKGVDKNEEKAFQLFQQSADEGSDVGLHNLALSYQKGAGVAKNEEKAFKLFQQIADRGSKCGLDKLATCYLEGKGVEKNESKAVELYQQAADLGDIYALDHLASCYKEGKGINKNLEKYFELTQKGVKLGNPWAQFNLAVCFRDGVGVASDMPQAFKWFSKSFMYNEHLMIFASNELERLIHEENGMNHLKKYLEDYLVTTWLDQNEEKFYPINEKGNKEIVKKVLEDNVEKLKIKNTIDSFNKLSTYQHGLFNIKDITKIIHAYSQFLPREEIDQMNKNEQGLEEYESNSSESSLFVKRGLPC